MPLTVLEISKSRDGRLSDGKGLCLHKKGSTGKWIWRYSFEKKRREMGLGTWPTVSLADARLERNKWALVRSQGKDPITERKALKAAEAANLARRDPSLEELAREFFEIHKKTLRQGGASARWMSPLEVHVFPKIGRKPISQIRDEDIQTTVRPIWHSKHPTAEKAMQRLRLVFRHGKRRGYECDPFTVEVAEDLLGTVHHKVKPMPAVPWQEIPKLYSWFEGRGTSASCLQFMVLTLVRATGCRRARFDEFDGDVWTVPAERMKGQEGTVDDFRVPLSPEAIRIIERRRELGSEWVFPGHRGKPISLDALSKFMRENRIEGTPHGFRTSFRTWVQDNDTAPFDVAETILAHKVGGKTERAYARSDILERRRPVMLKWSQFVIGEDKPASAQ